MNEQVKDLNDGFVDIPAHKKITVIKPTHSVSLFLEAPVGISPSTDTSRYIRTKLREIGFRRGQIAGPLRTPRTPNPWEEA